MQNKFGEFLKELRLDRKLTLRDVQDKVKISNAYLSQVERGERNIPTMKILVKLANVYGVPVSLLNKKAEDELKRQSQETFDSLTMGYSDEHPLGSPLTMLNLDSLIDPDPIQAGLMKLTNIPPPDIAFICKAYGNLSNEGRQKVKDYIQFITEQESKK